MTEEEGKEETQKDNKGEGIDYLIPTRQYSPTSRSPSSPTILIMVMMYS